MRPGVQGSISSEMPSNIWEQDEAPTCTLRSSSFTLVSERSTSISACRDLILSFSFFARVGLRLSRSLACMGAW